MPLTKNNVPIDTPVTAGQQNNNFYAEVAKIQSLAANLNRTTTGQVSWTSESSGITYSTTGSTVANVDNKGENGLYNLLIYTYGTNPASNNRFIVTAQDYNEIANALNNYASGDTAVEKANKIATSGAIGGATQPVYVSASGAIVAATSYANATVGNATNAVNATNASTAAVATKLGTNTVGSTSAPIYLNNGVPTECANVVSSTATTATKLATPRGLKVNLASNDAANFDGSTSVSNIGVDGVLGINNGGTGRETSPTIRVNLGSTNAATMLDPEVDAVQPGVTGVLPVANGGTGVSSAQGGATRPVYLSGSGIAACTYGLGAGVAAGTSGKLAYYSANDSVGALSTSVGSATAPIYLNAGVPAACSFELKATVNAASAAGKLAYYSGTTAVGAYTGTVGAKDRPIYLNGGVPTAGVKIGYGTELPASGMVAGDIFIKI